MALGKAFKESEIATGSIESVSSVVELPLDEEERHGSAEMVQDSTTSTSNSSEKLLASLLFAIPLPKPSEDYLSAHDAVRPVLLYTLPRAVYQKPPKDPETKKRPKEKISKKISRSWNKSIQDGEDIKRGDFESPSIAQKCLGALFRWTAFSLRFITTCDNQMLARLPPIKKLDQVHVIYLGKPTGPIDLDRTHESNTEMSPEAEAEQIFVHDLSQTKQKTTIRIVLSGIILPIALAAEIFVPLVFEISLIYFLVQYRGWRKVKFLLKRYENKHENPSASTRNDLESGNSEITQSSCEIFKFKVIELDICQEIRKLTYSACSEFDNRKFPILQDTKINSQVLINKDEVNEITTRSEFESNSKGKIGSELKRELPSVDLKANIVPVQMSKSNDGIAIEIQYNDKNTVTLEAVHGINDNAQPTDVLTIGVVKNEPKGGAPVHEPRTIDGAQNESQSDRETMIISTEVTEKETNPTRPKENISLDPSSLESKNQPKPVAHVEIAASLIKLFKESLPPNVVARYELNERRVAEDFHRVLRRRTKEYVRSIKKRA